MQAFSDIFRKNRTLWITLAILLVLFLLAIQGMETKDWVVTVLRGLSVGAVIFLAAAGLSLIFGLMDVLNLAHGTLFMVGAYVGWTTYIRPDTVVDVLPPLALLAAGLSSQSLWAVLLERVRLPGRAGRLPAAFRLWPWAGLSLAVLVLALTLGRYPISIWDPEVYEDSPIVHALVFEQGRQTASEPIGPVGIAAVTSLGGTMIGSALFALSLAGLARQRTGGGQASRRWPRGAAVAAALLAVVGIIAFLANDVLTVWLYRLSTTWRFVMAVGVAALTGAALGGFMEVTLIRPLYARPIYQLMLTLGLGVVGHEIVITVWGRPDFTMPKPDLFTGSGEGCPATSLGDWLAHQCSTINFMETRVRSYNEVFLILVGLVVLVVVWLLIQRSRLGMIIRAGVQDSQMVEALGVDVRRVFTLVFAVGVGLAALGGVLSGPSTGLSARMGETLLLSALIALAIGGLTSFPGAAAGAVLVGLLQQFIIKYGQIGIQLPFLAEPFKPSPPLVPASTILLMVVILLALPQGLFGRKE